MEQVTTNNAWSADKAEAFKTAVLDVIAHVKVDSKEMEQPGPITLYEAQRRFLDGVLDGLKRGVHHFVVLKARQLGLSTIVQLLTIVYMFIFPGTQGAVVFDTDANKEKFRVLLKRAMESMPRAYRVGVEKNNRSGLVLKNGSSLDYLVAGIRKGKASGGLGRSRALNFLHASECSSWGDEEGLRSLERSLAQKHPNRLFIWESTARGLNIFHDMWEEARADDLSKCAIFIGWWAKEDYSYHPGDPLFDRYGVKPPTEEERARIAEVKERYGHEVTMEQLAWFRHQSDPGATGDGGMEDTDDGITRQELPWTEEEAWVQTGSKFFPTGVLTQASIEASKEHYKGFRYFLGDDFFATQVEQVTRPKDATLRVWEEPIDGATYVVGADPAYGSGDTADRYCAQVLRVYADGVDQVAEFCDPLLEPFQFAWVLTHLCGAYSNARFLLELNGPGEAVWTAFRELRLILTRGYMREETAARGLRNVFDNVRNYVWKRSDIISGSSNAWHFKTNQERKYQAFVKLKDCMIKREIRIRSMECLEEMRFMNTEGAGSMSIAAEGSKKDDRPMALALALQAWHDSERTMLIARGQTRAVELRRPNMTPEELVGHFTGQLAWDHLADRARERRLVRLGEKRGAWRGGGPSRWKW